MTNTRRVYEEGDIFCVPLSAPIVKQGYVLGVVARENFKKKNKFFLGYFFSKVFTKQPKESDMFLNPLDALKVYRVADISLCDGHWPIVGKISNWDRSNWPLPSFVRRDVLRPGIAWRITYSEDDLFLQIDQTPEPWDSTLETDGYFDTVFLEDNITELLFFADGTPK